MPPIVLGGAHAVDARAVQRGGDPRTDRRHLHGPGTTSTTRSTRASRRRGVFQGQLDQNGPSTSGARPSPVDATAAHRPDGKCHKVMIVISDRGVGRVPRFCCRWMRRGAVTVPAIVQWLVWVAIRGGSEDRIGSARVFPRPDHGTRPPRSSPQGGPARASDLAASLALGAAASGAGGPRATIRNAWDGSECPARGAIAAESAWLPRCRPRCSCGSFPTDLDDRPSGRRICSRLRPVTIARQAVGWTARFAGDAGGRSRPDHFLAKSGIRARRGAWRAAGRRRDPTVAWRREWEHVEPEGRMRAPRGGRPTRLFSTRIASTGVMRLDHDRIRIRSWRSRTGDARRQAIRPLRARHRGASPRSDRPRRSPDRRRRG